MDGINGRSDCRKSRAIVLRCDDRSYREVLDLIRMVPGAYIVFTKSSHLKLVVEEEDW